MRFLGFRRHPLDESDLSAYLDDALPEGRRARLEAHLHSCGDCARKLEELKQVVAELRALPPAKAPRSFALSPEVAAISHREGRLASEGRRTNARRAYLGLSGATVAAALLLVAAFGLDLFVVSSGGQPTSLPAATSADKPLGMPQAAAALPDATAPGYDAAKRLDKETAGQAAVPPVSPSSTGAAAPGEVIVPPATPTGGQAGGGAVGSGQIAPPPVPPPLPIGTPGENVEPPLNVPGVPATSAAPPEKNALLPANQPTAAATPNAPLAMLPAVSPPGVATPAPSLGETSALGPQAQPAERSPSHVWLWVLEGAAGGLFIGFGISAFWMRRRWIRINRDS